MVYEPIREHTVDTIPSPPAQPTVYLTHYEGEIISNTPLYTHCLCIVALIIYSIVALY